MLRGGRRGREVALRALPVTEQTGALVDGALISPRRPPYTPTVVLGSPSASPRGLRGEPPWTTWIPFERRSDAYAVDPRS